jgi:hypothetical protein
MVNAQEYINQIITTNKITENDSELYLDGKELTDTMNLINFKNLSKLNISKNNFS